MKDDSHKIDFSSILEEMRICGMKCPRNKIIFSVPDAKIVLKNAFDYFLSMQGTSTVWMNEYDKVAEWLTNNDGRGILLFGDCGRGKSLLGRYVLPAILLKYCRKVVAGYSANEMNEKLDEVLSKHIISLDDIGTEEMIVDYGNKRYAFPEIIDAAEKESKIVIVSTNLEAKGLETKYGTRVLDRIMSTMYRVKFEGKSLRG